MSRAVGARGRQRVILYTQESPSSSAARMLRSAELSTGRPPTGPEIREIMTWLDGVRTELAVKASAADARDPIRAAVIRRSSGAT